MNFLENIVENTQIGVMVFDIDNIYIQTDTFLSF